jgi:hypothetical protein
MFNADQSSDWPLRQRGVFKMAKELTNKQTAKIETDSNVNRRFAVGLMHSTKSVGARPDTTSTTGFAEAEVSATAQRV